MVATDRHPEHGRLGLVEEQGGSFGDGESDLLDLVDGHVEPGGHARNDVAQYLHGSGRRGNLGENDGGEIGHSGDLYYR